jgi:hypothetical protein
MSTYSNIAVRACLIFVVGCHCGGVAKTRDASLPMISSGLVWTANIGVVVDSPVSYNPDRLFADAIKSAREFASYGDLNTPVGLDSDGWPKEDASILVWEGAAGFYVNGRYRFSCDGRVTGNNVTARTRRLAIGAMIRSANAAPRICKLARM